MTEIQKIFVELLSEIDSICNEHNLRYYLAEDTALSAYRSNGFDSDTVNVTVNMPFADMMTFRDIVNLQNNPDRAIDSIYDNAEYPDLFLRYVNNNTLHFSFLSGYGRKYQGLHVRIKAIRSNEVTLSSKVANFLELGWISNHAGWTGKGMSSRRKRISSITAKKISKSPDKYIAALKRSMTRAHGKLNYEDKLVIKNMYAKETVFPAGLFAEYDFLEFEGQKFRVPKRIEDYLLTVYGSLWQSKVNGGSEKSERKIVDPRLPHAEYFKYLKENGIKLTTQSTAELEGQLLRKKKANSKIIDSAWKKVLFVGAKYKIEELYINRSDEIVALQNAEQWNELEAILDEYHAAVTRFEKYGMRIFINEEIDNAYLLTLEHTGKKEFADALKAIEKDA